MKIAVMILRYTLTGNTENRKVDVLYTDTGLCLGYCDNLQNHPPHREF